MRIGAAVVIVLGVIGYLAFTAQASNKSYFVTIPEMAGMGDKAYSANLRLDGFVKPDTIQQAGTHVNFVLTQFESHNPKATGDALNVKVVYDGTETVSSMPRSFRPSAPRSTLRPLPAQPRPVPRLPRRTSAPLPPRHQRLSRSTTPQRQGSNPA